MRTELIAMHGNMAELKDNGLRGQIQIYPHCFNLDIISSGSATPEGVSFPGAYKPDDTSFKFQPFMTYGNDTTGGTEHNSKFVSHLIHCCSNITNLIIFHNSRSHQAHHFTRGNMTPLVAHSQSSKKPAHILQISQSHTRT